MALTFAPSVAHVVCGIALVLVCIYAMYFSQKKKRSMDPELKRNGKALVQQAANWTSVATQDTVPLIACMHANYAKAYITCARTIFTDQEILEFARVDAKRLEDHIFQVQQDRLAAVST